MGSLTRICPSVMYLRIGIGAMQLWTVSLVLAIGAQSPSISTSQCIVEAAGQWPQPPLLQTDFALPRRGPGRMLNWQCRQLCIAVPMDAKVVNPPLFMTTCILTVLAPTHAQTTSQKAVAGNAQQKTNAMTAVVLLMKTSTRTSRCLSTVLLMARLK